MPIFFDSELSKTPAGRRFEQFSYFGVKLIVACHMVHDMLKKVKGLGFRV